MTGFEPLELKASALPTEPQPQPLPCHLYFVDGNNSRSEDYFK